jgi:hypothetical protein
MPHMVIFRSAEGKPGYHQADTLDDAVRFVEHLRNQEQVPDARIFRMQEVPIEFKTYVKVEVTAAPAGSPSGDGPEPAPVGAGVAPVAAETGAPAAPAAGPPVAAAAAAAPVGASPKPAADEAPRPADKGDKHEDVVVDPMPVGQSGAAASNRFGRFNRG